MTRLETALRHCRVGIGVAACGSFFGCAESDPGDPDGAEIIDGQNTPPAAAEIRLVDHGLWQLVEAPDADPFATARGRPTVHACAPGAILEPAAGLFEVELAGCRERYVSLHQASLERLVPGDQLRFDLSHLLLRPLSMATTEAYLGLVVGGRMLWEQTIVIEAEANDYVVTRDVEATAEIGSDVVLHIDNHGENAYILGPITIERP
jgi:hypothetical protein